MDKQKSNGGLPDYVINFPMGYENMSPRLTMTPKELSKAFTNETFVKFSDWQDIEPPEREWLIGGLIPMGAVSALFGQAGIGKSYLCQQMITALAMGYNSFGEVPEGKRYRVLAMFCEDDRNELIRRQKRICKSYGIGMRDLESYLFTHTFTETDSYLFKTTRDGVSTTAVFNRLLETITQVKPQLLLLDNIGKILAGSKLQEEAIGELITRLTRLCKDMAILLIGHTGKPNEDGKTTEYYGSVAFNNHVRFRSFLERLEDGYVKLSAMKNNYGDTTYTLNAKFDGEVFEVVSDEVLKREKRVLKDLSIDVGKAAILEFIESQARQNNQYSGAHNSSNLPYVIDAMLDSNDVSITKGLDKKTLKSCLAKLKSQSLLISKQSETYDSSRNKPYYLVVK
jgi:RecA-family ATPase